jgi:large subunit ribosomal protein L24
MTRTEAAQRKLARKIRVEAEHRGWHHGEIRPLDIREGDTVEVIAGKEKGKRGVVDHTIPDKQRIVVRGVNMSKRHKRATSQVMQGGIVDFNAPFAYSNVMLVCSRCDKKTRIKHQILADGQKHIVCMHCGEKHERVSEV